MSNRHSRVLAALALGLAAASTGWAQQSESTAAPASLDKPDAPLVGEKKLGFLKSRIDRKKKMSNPARADMPHQAVAWWANKRTGPIITRGEGRTVGMRPVDPRQYLDALNEARKTPVYSTRTRKILSAQALAAPGAALGTWQALGPSNQGGRTRQVLIDPNNPSIMYAASVGGGVWKSTNAGGTWSQLTDLVLPNIAVASLAMDPNNSQVLYAGTGEGFFNGDAIRGTGIFKTTDGGATWAALTNTVPPAGTLGSFSYVTQIVVSPRNSQRVYATTRDGLYRSNDGGTNWTRLLNAAGVNGCQDVVLQAKRAVGYVFAACGTFTQGAIYRALDSATGTFAQVFTTTNMGRTSLAIAPSNENYVYALASDSNSYGMLGVFRSTSAGAAGTWTTQVSSADPNPINRVQLTNPVYAFAQCVGSANAGNYNQGWYDNVIAVDPVDPERVWTGGIDLMRSDDGGRNWGVASYWWFDRGEANYAHADQHVIRFHPGYNGTTNTTMYVGNDGGVFRTDNARGATLTTVNEICGVSQPANMVSWTELNTNYTTTQFYAGSVYPDGSAFMGGMQDNGTWRGTTASTAWTKLTGGDGGYTAVDTLGDANAANDVLFAEYTGLSIQKSTDGGATFNDAINGINDPGFDFIAPFAMNPGNKQHLWSGGWMIWRTVNQATNWTQASLTTPGNGSVSAVAPSPSNTNRVILGMSDGYLLYNHNALAAGNTTIWASSQPRTAFVSAAAFDPNDANVAYATYQTFSGNSVYKSTNGGISWVAVPGTGVNVLPRVPANAVVVDPTSPGRVYVGTDIGVYTSIDGGANWYRENTGFGNVSVEHLEINSTGTRYLFAFTHGRGAWRVPLNP